MKKDIACQIVRRWNLIGKTDHMYMYMYVAMAFVKSTGSISDCIWRQREIVIESNVGQREKRRHTHTLSFTREAMVAATTTHTTEKETRRNSPK